MPYMVALVTMIRRSSPWNNHLSQLSTVGTGGLNSKTWGIRKISGMEEASRLRLIVSQTREFDRQQ